MGHINFYNCLLTLSKETKLFNRRLLLLLHPGPDKPNRMYGSNHHIRYDNRIFLIQDSISYPKNTPNKINEAQQGHFGSHERK